MRYTYETTENSSYVVAIFFDGEEIDGNQLQVLENNDLQNVIKPSYRVVGEDVLISYNITSKVSLEQATANRKITKNGFVNIIEGALAALEDVQKYGLFSSGIVFDEKNVYVKPGTYEPSFVYLPYPSQDDGIEPVKKFILSLIMGSKIERINDGFIQVLFDTLNNPKLCADDLREFCNQQTKGRMSAAKLAKNARFSVITPTMINSESVISGCVYKKEDPKPEKPKDIASENKVVENRKAESPGKGNMSKYKFILVQLFILVIITANSNSGFFDNADGTLNVKYLLGIIAASCVVDFVIYKELFAHKHSDEESDDKQNFPGSQWEKKASAEEKKAMTDAAESHSAPSPIHSAPKSLEQIYAGAQGSEFEDTVLLEDEILCAHLEFFENGIFKKIKLDNEVTTVGKLSSQCDCAISNNKISRIHAQFIVRGNKYFVKDCNSTNGTYINGSTQRIASNEEYQIYDGDCIRLANVDLTLKC